MLQMKTITVTPAGRRRYLEILVPYLLSNREYISEHHFWLNTVVKEDIEYIEMLAGEHPDFFKINRKKFIQRSGDRIWQYYKDYVDDDTIYIKLDDDICFIEKDALKNLIEYRVNHPKPLFVFGNIVNNAVCSYFLQKKGIIPLSWGRVGYDCLDYLGWENPAFAGKLHKKFLKDIKSNNMNKWKIDNVVLDDFKRFSIGVMCWFGRDLKGLPDLNLNFGETIDHRTGKWRFPNGDESFLSQDLPQRLNRPNEICGKALFGHFAFYIQRDYLESYTVLLDDYKAIALDGNRFSGRLNRQKEKFVRNIKRHIYKFKSSIGIVIKNNFPKVYKRIKEVKR